MRPQWRNCPGRSRPGPLPALDTPRTRLPSSRQRSRSRPVTPAIRSPAKPAQASPPHDAEGNSAMPSRRHNTISHGFPDYLQLWYGKYLSGIDQVGIPDSEAVRLIYVLPSEEVKPCGDAGKCVSRLDDITSHVGGEPSSVGFQQCLHEGAVVGCESGIWRRPGRWGYAPRCRLRRKRGSLSRNNRGRCIGDMGTEQIVNLSLPWCHCCQQCLYSCLRVLTSYARRCMLTNGPGRRRRGRC
jgi:hypothetical protein